MKKVLLFLSLLGGNKALGGVITALQNQDNPLPIHAELGTILQLPGAVRTVTPSKYFEIKAVGAATDVKTFHLKPLRPAHAELVTFVLASGKALSFKVMPTAEGDKFIDVQMLPRKTRDQKFLTAELQMMRAMILNESQGFIRESLDSPVDSPTDSLSLKLLKVYRGEGIMGYEFLVRNKSSEVTPIHLSSLGFSSPNRALLSQADSVSLKPCPLLQKEPSCETRLRLVVKGTKEERPALIPVGKAPYVKPGTLLEGARRESY